MVFINFYVVYKRESSHQSSSDEEGVDTYNAPAPQPHANQFNSIDNNIIQASVSTPLQPSSPIILIYLNRMILLDLCVNFSLLEHQM